MKTVILVGSSIFAQWAQASTMLPHYRIVNRAVGGTTTADWIERLPEVLTAVSPDAILYYCGSNDLNRNISQEEILVNVSACRRIICRISPTVRFAYFGIIKALQKTGKWKLIDSLNQHVCASLLAEDIYVESNEVFFHNGAVVHQFFLDDKLHLTDEAYVHLANYAAPIIERWLTDNSDYRTG